MKKSGSTKAKRKMADTTGTRSGATNNGKQCSEKIAPADGGIQPEYLRIGYATLHLDQDGSLFLWIEGIGAYIGVFEDLFENHGLKDALRPGIKLLPREVEPVREAMKAWRHMIEMVGLN